MYKKGTKLYFVGDDAFQDYGTTLAQFKKRVAAYPSQYDEEPIPVYEVQIVRVLTAKVETKHTIVLKEK